MKDHVSLWFPWVGIHLSWNVHPGNSGSPLTLSYHSYCILFFTIFYNSTIMNPDKPTSLWTETKNLHTYSSTHFGPAAATRDLERCFILRISVHGPLMNPIFGISLINFKRPWWTMMTHAQTHTDTAQSCFWLSFIYSVIFSHLKDGVFVFLVAFGVTFGM